MSIVKKIYSALFIYILVLSSTANAEEIKKIGKFKDWETIVYKMVQKRFALRNPNPFFNPQKKLREIQEFL